MENFDIIHALCRSALSNPSDAVIHQIERLAKSLRKDGDLKAAKILENLLSGQSRTLEMTPSQIAQSFVLGGEELTPQTPIPVDKESSTPILEVVFTQQLNLWPPIFNPHIQDAVESILQEWTNYERLVKIEARPSKSCLIYGAPGTGKTHLALWISKQINLPVVLARLDGLLSSFLGTSSKNIGNLFSFANKYKCILLLDEFDAIAKLRDDAQEVGEIKRVVNTLLQNLDVRAKTGFTIGVTNHEKLLDPAIWRRFEVQIEIPKPTSDVRIKLMNYFLKTLELEPMQIRFLAWALENSSGADIEGLSLWLKKTQLLQPNLSLVDQIRKFAALNSGRININKRELLLSSDEVLATALLQEPIYTFKQKDIASLLGINESTLSKQLSKNK